VAGWCVSVVPSDVLVEMCSVVFLLGGFWLCFVLSGAACRNAAFANAQLEWLASATCDACTGCAITRAAHVHIFYMQNAVARRRLLPVALCWVNVSSNTPNVSAVRPRRQSEGDVCDGVYLRSESGAPPFFAKHRAVCALGS
jgi:hypothetical protein